MTCGTTRKHISSLESADGRTRFASLDGRMTRQCGRDHVLVSRFRARDSAKAMPMDATSGPLFTASSPSAVLQRFLENRLRAILDVNGSPEYVLTWKIWDMPLGPPICALRASARHTSGKGCIGSQPLLKGWATPRARDGKGNGVSKARAACGKADSLDLQCKTVSRNGMAPPSPFSARTDGRALPLNPRFSLWLQGYPETWADCAEPVTRSSRRLRPRS